MRCLLTSGAVGLAAVTLAACGHPAAQSSPTTGPPATSGGGPLVAPKTTPAQDAEYFTDLARADPSLSSYVNTYGNVALKALITDGSAFCAFLARDGGIDDAMSSVVIGANGVENQTHLPSSVATFNAIDAVALITLCPGEQKLIPAADQAHIRSLANSLGAGSG